MTIIIIRQLKTIKNNQIIIILAVSSKKKQQNMESDEIIKYRAKKIKNKFTISKKK